MLRLLPLLYSTATLVQAHIAAWNEGMYCLNGTSGQDNQNANEAVTPLYQLSFSQWWMHHNNKCDEFPPAPGKFLQLPAGGSFTVELADNRAHTTFSYGGRYTSDWGDGKAHPEFSSKDRKDECITSPNLHTTNETEAAGTAFAISYHSNIKDVTPENLVVFSVKYHTPWKRLTTYDVPLSLPACPAGGCHCVWGWIPNHCGQSNMYMLPYKCIVTGAKSTIPLDTPASPPRWCEDDPTKCIKGAKQIIFWAQKDGNNVIVEGTQRDGHLKSPGYNQKMGFREGAQDDIFQKPRVVSSRHLQVPMMYEQ